MNSKRFKVAKSLISSLPASAIIFALEGVISDIKANKHPKDALLIHMWGDEGTVGAITSHVGWDTNPMIISQLSAAVTGRMIQFALADAGFSPMEMTTDQMLEITTATDAVENKATIHVVGKEAFDSFNAKVKHLTFDQKKTMTELMKELFG